MKPNGLGRDVGVAGAALVFAILHSLQGDPVLLYGLRALGTVVLLAVFVVRAWQLPGRHIWVGLFLTMAALPLGDLSVAVTGRADASTPFYIVTYALGTLTGIRLLRMRARHEGRSDSLVDTLFVSLAVGVVLWTVMIGPDGGALDTGTATVVVLSTLIMSIIVGLTTSPGAKPRALTVLCLGVTFALVAAMFRGELVPDAWISVVAFMARVLVLVSPLAHDAADLIRPSTPQRTHRPRLAMIGIGLLLLTGLNSVHGIRSGWLASAGSVVGLPLLAVLLLWRVSQVIRENDEITMALHEAAHTDALTLLENRRAIQRSVSRAVADGQHVTLLFVDLNGFKAINDRHGHDVGDEVLVHVSARMRTAVRTDDVVGRLGGDEFLVVLPGAVSQTTVAEVIERLEHALSRPLVIDGETLWVGASIGLASRTDQESADALLARADAAMYTAKRSAPIARDPARTPQPVFVTSWSADMGLRQRQIPLDDPSDLTTAAT